MAFPGIPNPQEVGIPAPPEETTALLRAALEPQVNPVDASLHAILEYGRLLMAANTVTNLTGAKDWTTLIEAHILDCVLAAKFLPAGARTFFDWGCGGGLPGLVWAGMFPERHFHLCERNKKKAGFLVEAAAAMEFMHVDVHATQGEESIRTVDPHANLLVARAVEPLSKLLRRLYRPTVPRIDIFLMAGPSWERDWEENEELEENWHLRKVDRYQLGTDRGDRFTLQLRRRNR
ncbi:MAG: class I SAM-dependent methyltransferase [Planctomycetota bacterium]|nr:class I SAM-dependent methyltransferase [Planctomycetota bacterium]